MSDLETYRYRDRFDRFSPAHPKNPRSVVYYLRIIRQARPQLDRSPWRRSRKNSHVFSHMRRERRGYVDKSASWMRQDKAARQQVQLALRPLRYRT